MRAIWSIAALIFVLDQVTKYYVVIVLDLATRLAIDVLPPVLNLRMAWNYGINFGLFSGGESSMRWVLIAVAFGIVGFVLYWVHREPPGRLGRIGAGLLIGGAFGNVVDRVQYGAVADFLNMSCCGIHNPFAFNVADIAIVAGALMLALFPGGGDSSTGKKAP